MGRHSLGVVLYMLGWGLESLGFPEPGCSTMFFCFVLQSLGVILCKLVCFCIVRM